MKSLPLALVTAVAELAIAAILSASPPFRATGVSLAMALEAYYFYLLARRAVELKSAGSPLSAAVRLKALPMFAGWALFAFVDFGKPSNSFGLIAFLVGIASSLSGKLLIRRDLE